MGLAKDIIVATLGYIKLGLAGVYLKNSAGHLLVRNTGDTADANVTAALVKISGEALEINSDAAGAGADWKYTLQRPTSGMAAAVTLTLPDDDGTAGQVLSTDGNGVMDWVSAGVTSHLDTVDTTSLAFDTASPVTAFTLPANGVVDFVQVVVDTAFNGTAPTMSVGITGTVSKYMPTTALDLKTTGVYEWSPGLVADAGTNAIILTYVADSSTAGAARVLVHYSVPA